jgi:GNAT superfamily N-acetyltransferase
MPAVTPSTTPLATLRDPAPGDMGRVVTLHGEVYAREYGWDARFEGMVAGIVSDYVKHHRAGLERCWVAEWQGQMVGSAFVVRKDDNTAQLRMLIVSPEARGQGLGRRLVDECLAFARQAGYRRITLWTNDVLVAARQIYVATGFVRVAVEEHQSFGQRLMGETWERGL